MKQKNAAIVSIVSNSSLVLFKIIAGIITGSVSIISEAIHSSIDLAAAIMAFFSIRQAGVPPDSRHPYGHGKIENLSAVAEAMLIILAAVLIVIEAVEKIKTGVQLSMPGVAIAVMGISVVVNFLVARYLYKVAKETDSPALEADAKHLSADIYSSLAVLAAIVLVALTGRQILDPIAAVIISLFIFYEGVMITKKSIGSLLDNSLPEDEVSSIRKILESESGHIKDYHELRTRKAGSERHIDLHLTVCASETISKTHATMDIIENRISMQLNNCKVVIHPEPCNAMTDRCPDECNWNKDNGGIRSG
ncbi:cation diffusion facilitator family transporter [Candidatus Magnetominusculus xianensis]|uniref:Cation transporter n=1 Tax=Candidatus Magnetominusculus xianensis TaxID=1748249 RepID=A0ABR5SJK7_9BACT|nr:cation diffusion facilitator family transporter [Candidatus Magnetominusculus xianensis]KWT92689.1 cation transporter [Candidatus Magnetominusculus xianensis]MBF0403760.1 cation transporter [Nitrospirota bacterium]